MNNLIFLILPPLQTLFTIDYYTFVVGSGLLIGVLIYIILSFFRGY